MPSDTDIPKKTTNTVVLLTGITFTSTIIEYENGRKEITQEIKQDNE